MRSTIMPIRLALIIGLVVAVFIIEAMPNLGGRVSCEAVSEDTLSSSVGLDYNTSTSYDDYGCTIFPQPPIVLGIACTGSPDGTTCQECSFAFLEHIIYSGPGTGYFLIVTNDNSCHQGNRILQGTCMGGACVNATDTGNDCPNKTAAVSFNPQPSGS